ncbi:thiol reductant ABC exporter subunit CydD [Cypionkella aquatica]|uniref:Thiol reductant ABC exporter subunit CydD n=2 Tax=Cypionkella aquatica TaxID=1756042 RepID=A0AA37X1X9_9RHOB|nr:thiol reductant ABC exporter subunit CydD [Cypionkella aquatica]
MAGQDDQTLRDLLAPERGRLRRAALISALAATLWPAQAAVVALALAGLLAAAPAPIWPYVLGFALLGILRALLNTWAEGLTYAAGHAVVTRIRADLVAREARNTDGPAAGIVAALAAEKLDALLPYISRYAPARARVTVVPLLILALAFWHSWAVGVVFLITGPLIPVFMALIGWAAQAASQRQMAEIGSLNDVLVERLSALLDIRLLGASGAMITGFAQAADGLRAQTMAVLRVAFLSSAVLELFAAIGVAMVAVFVGFSLLGLLGFGTYGTPLAPAAGIFLLLLAPEFYQPLRDLSAAWHDRAAALAVAAELAAWQAANPAPLLGQGARVARLPGPARIEASGLRLHLGGQTLILPDFSIAPGEKIALVGASGTGKTTLLRLIAGMQQIDAGEISVAGQRLDAANADAWRARLGWMPQNPHFLNASLRHNLAFGGADSGADLGPALQAAVVQDVVAALPRGLATHLGETGAGLSGGEARRLTLARALYARPDVLLADEPTADLDAETARAVRAGLLNLAATGCTLIIATHDPRLAAEMDRVIRVGAA